MCWQTVVEYNEQTSLTCSVCGTGSKSGVLLCSDVSGADGLRMCSSTRSSDIPTVKAANNVTMI